MDLFVYLTDEDRYRRLLRQGMQEACRRMVLSSEDANDIASEALERLLDYFARKPDQLYRLESMAEGKVTNYLRKALRNHIINIIKKRQRQVFLAWEEIGEPAAPVAEPVTAAARDLPDIRRELHFFIEEKFGREKWAGKKEAVDLFIERVAGKLRMREMQDRHPGRNIAVLNTEAHRIVKKYARWVQKNGRSPADAGLEGME